MEHKEILSREIQNLNPQQAREVLRYVGYVKSLSDTDKTEVQTSQTNRRQAILDGFRKLRELGTFDAIDDPAEWQRNIRKDRPLPGR